MDRPTLPPLHSLDLLPRNIPLPRPNVHDLDNSVDQQDQGPIQLPQLPSNLVLAPLLPTIPPNPGPHQHIDAAPTPTQRVSLRPLSQTPKTVPTHDPRQPRHLLTLTDSLQHAHVIVMVKPMRGPPGHNSTLIQAFVGEQTKDLLSRRHELPKDAQLRPYSITTFDHLDPSAPRPANTVVVSDENLIHMRTHDLQIVRIRLVKFLKRR